MSKLSNFILKYDKTIVIALTTIVPSLIVLLAFIPMVIENYTFNAFLNGDRATYLDFVQSFRFLQLFVLGYMIVGLGYNFIRRMVETDITEKTGPYITASNTFISFFVAAIIALVCQFVNVHYENKNVLFITSKLVDIKNYIKDGKCDAARAYSPSVVDDPKWGNISDCSTITTKLPGTLYFRHAGDYASSSKLADGTVKTVTKNEPNIMTYKGYFAPFCRSLEDKNHRLYLEFSDIQVHGMSPLSDDFKTSSCEEYKGIGQIQFYFK